MATDQHFTNKWAHFWNVTQRTIQRWVKNGLAVDNVPAMISWSRGQKRLPAGFVKRVAEMRMENGLDADPDWSEFEEQAAAAPQADGSQHLDRLERYRDFFGFKLNKSIKAGDQDGIKFWEARFIAQEKAIRETKLLAEKLGLDNGETLRRNTEAFVAGIAFWSMRSVDDLITYLAPRLVGLTYPEEVREVMEPVLLDARFVGPLARGSQVESATALPAWVPDVVRAAVGNYIEDGERAVDEHRGAG